MCMHSGELCGSSAVIARDSCSVKSSVTDHRHHHHHPHHHVQQQQQTSQLHQPTSHQTTAVAAAHSLQQSCYDEQRRLQTHHHRQHQQQRQPGDADRVVAPSSADCVALQPQQRVAAAAGTDGVLRHNHQLDHYGDTAAAKTIKSEPNDSAMAAVVATAVGEARKMGEAKSGSGGRTAVGSTSNSVTTTSADNAVESLLHGVSSTSQSSSSLNDAISRHHHHHHQSQQQAADMQQTSSFTVSSLVHPTNGRNAGSGSGFASVVDDDQGARDVSVDGVLNSIERAGGVVDSDSTCFDQSAAAAAAAQWFAAAGGHHQGAAQPVGYSSRCTPEFYMQRLHASIAADRRHSVAAAACIGLADADVDGTVPPSTPAFNHHAAGGGYAAWYGTAQSADAVCLPSAGSSAYISGGGLHDMFDVTAASRMLSTRQSCAQLQTDSPFRSYYGSGSSGITHGPTAYAAYAEDCTSAKY